MLRYLVLLECDELATIFPFSQFLVYRKTENKSKNASRLVMRAEKELHAPRLLSGLAYVHA